ncbi:MAG: ribonuclease HI family protein [Candidatus Pacebacteria bacterium]|nr:ribonuclease HI family protein [Candidatus Paceibacterota bacterium]
MKKMIIYTDGGSRNNPGIAGAGVYITDADGNEIKKIKKFLGIQTNNWAEYEALILGLEGAKKILGKNSKNIEIEVRMDSELIVKQMKGEYRVKQPALFEQFVRVNNLKVDFSNIKFVHIPRAKNGEADKLANEAMDEGE